MRKIKHTLWALAASAMVIAFAGAFGAPYWPPISTAHATQIRYAPDQKTLDVVCVPAHAIKPQWLRSIP